MQRLIKTDTVKTNYVENELNLAGKIQAIPSKNIKIYPLISGIVKNLYVELGDYVSEGQPLAEIISSEVAEFEKELANAEADLQIAKKNLNVAKDMFDSKLISEKEYITAQKEVEKAEAELKRLKAIFSIYHINETGTYTLKSPISGYIITKNISQGMQIRADATDEMMTIADIDKLWAVANVYESDMSKIKVGEKACIETIAYPDSLFVGKIDKIFEMLDPVTRTMKIAIQLDNKNYLLKPEMYAKVKLKYFEKYQLPYVPSQSVIFDNAKYYVLVYKSKCDIEVRNVEIEKSNKKRTYIKNGLKPGEVIITSSNLLIYDAITEQ
ncbi:MAG: efflux RND transporter periplasmic adaptor subunit [Candidatus Micrarchaeota archaeon]|nr:efflux RND transporter periplasmic adaptor subunit [Candidatus Micrarchaeota archaeon]